MYKFDITILPTPMAMMASFDLAAAGIKSLREPLKESIQTIIAPSIRERFDVGGPGWEPLSESRLLQKAAQGLPEDTLIASGTLRRVAGQLNIWKINGGYGSGEAEAFVSNLPGAEYGTYHDSGTSRVPQREFLYIDTDDEVKIEEVFEAFIASRFRKAGF